MLDLFRNRQYGRRDRRVAAYTREIDKEGGEEIELKERTKTKWKLKTKEREEEGGCAELRLRRDWDSAEETGTIVVIQPGFGVEPTTGSILGEMKGRGVRRSTQLQRCLEHEKGEGRDKIQTLE